MKKTIYLDYNATALPRPEALALSADIAAQPLNASSVHAMGRKAKQIVDTARRQIAALTGAEANNVIFNSGATEGNNTVLKHFAGQKILVSATEHPSVLEVRPDAPRIPVTSNGIIDLQALEDLLKEHKPALVSCQLVNSETGLIQPIREVSNLAQRHGAWLHCDAVQAAGRIPLQINELGIHFMTISSHKIGGPQGVGALILGQCGETPTLLHGGGQEKKARAGTENVAGIAGFGLAAELAHKEIPDYQSRIGALRTTLEDGLKSLSTYPSSRAQPRDLPAMDGDSSTALHSGRNDGNGIKIFCEDQPRAANTTFFGLGGANSQTLLMALDLDGICVSNGSACSSGSVKASHVLLAMGEDEAAASSAIRVSLGWNTTETDITAFLNAFTKILARI